MNPLFRIDFSISDSLKIVRKSVLIYETIISQASDSTLFLQKSRIPRFVVKICPPWGSLVSFIGETLLVQWDKTISFQSLWSTGLPCSSKAKPERPVLSSSHTTVTVSISSP